MELIDKESRKLQIKEANTKLVDWENPPTIEDIQKNVNDGKMYADEGLKTILENRKTIENKRVEKEKVKDKVSSNFSPKVARKQNEWRYSSLSEPFLSQPDLFSVKPKTHEDVARAKQAQLVLNYQFNNEIDKVSLIDTIVRAFVEDGTVITRTAWQYREYTTYEEYMQYTFTPPTSREDLEMFNNVLVAVQQDSSVFEELHEGYQQAIQQYAETGEVLIPVEAGLSKRKVVKVLEDRPDILVCDPSNIIIDPSCEGEINKANFIVHRFYTSKSELLASGIKYQNLDLIDFKGAPKATEYSTNEMNSVMDTFNFDDEARTKVEAFEYWGYWDITNNGTVTPIVITYINDVIIRMEENPYNHGKLPFDLAKMMPKRQDIYGESDAALVKDDQDLLGALSRGMIDLIGKSAAGQTGFAKGYLDPINKKKYLNGADYEVNASNVTQGIYQHQYPELSGGVLNLYTMHQNNVESLTGVKAFSTGLSGDSLGSSVGGIKSALTAAQKRELSLLRRLINLVKSIGKKVVAMNSQFLTEDYVVRLTNDEFVAVSPSDLSGMFDLDIDISTIEADNIRAGEISFMLQTLGNNAPFDVTKMLLIEVANLRKMPALAKKLEDWQPEPDPFTERLKELEIAKAEVDIMQIKAETTERLAKAEKALADARKAASEADLNDLDFVETETGTKHVRDIDKQQAQARGNMALEMIKQGNKAN